MAPLIILLDVIQTLQFLHIDMLETSLQFLWRLFMNVFLNLLLEEGLSDVSLDLLLSFVHFLLSFVMA